jgi:hypothetical protein
MKQHFDFAQCITQQLSNSATHFKVRVFFMIALGFLSSQVLKAQNYPFYDNLGVLQNTDFLKIDPLPPIPFSTSTTTLHKFEFGKGYSPTVTSPFTRGIFYGGNLGICQSTSGYGDQFGKWSFIGSWQRYLGSGWQCPSPPCSFTPGINYLINYHRWGDYSAHFGLRATSTTVNAGEAYNETYEAAQKDAVITWSYEYGKNPNRLIFQSIKGVHPTGTASNVAYEWATILSNGNIGSGIPDPEAQFEIKPIDASTSANKLSMQIFDKDDNSQFRVYKDGGQVSLGYSTSISTIPSALLSVRGTGDNLFNLTRNNGTNALNVGDNGFFTFTGKLGINTTPQSTGFDFHLLGGGYIEGGLMIDMTTAGYSAGVQPLSINGPLPPPLPPPAPPSTRSPYFVVQSDGDAVLYKDVYMPFIAPACTSYCLQNLAIDNTGQLSAISSPYIPNTLWEVGGNTFTTSGTYKFGGMSTLVTVDNDVDFYAGGIKAFGIKTKTSNLKYGFTDFVRNVGIWGGTTNTGYSNGGLAAIADEDWSLTIKSSLVNTDANYRRKGLFRCIDDGTSANQSTREVMTVGANDIGFFAEYYATIPTWSPYYTGSSTAGFSPKTYFINDPFAGDRYALMNYDSRVDNKLEINGETEIFGGPLKIWYDFLPTPPTYIPLVNIGNSSNYFGDIWGTDVYCDQLIPLYPGSVGTTGTSRMGNSTFYWEEIWGSFGNISTSDRRLKENIISLDHGLKTILNLKPYSYTYKSKPGIVHYGFVAQELKDLFPNTVVFGIESDTTNLGVIYEEFIPILALAMQQQQAIIDSLKQKLDLVIVSTNLKNKENVEVQKETLNLQPLLFQNHPNPFNGSTFIDYFLPPKAVNAFLRVIDVNGKLIKAFAINQTGFGQVELDCKGLAAATYYYSLLVNTEIIETKSMVIAGW